MQPRRCDSSWSSRVMTTRSPCTSPHSVISPATRISSARIARARLGRSRVRFGPSQRPARYATTTIGHPGVQSGAGRDSKGCSGNRPCSHELENPSPCRRCPGWVDRQRVALPESWARGPHDLAAPGCVSLGQTSNKLVHGPGSRYLARRPGCEFQWCSKTWTVSAGSES